MIDKSQGNLEKVNLELSLKNKLFQEAEEVAKLGSYVWFIKDDISIMSDNVFRILGFEPQSFTMSAEKFREFTHPDDLEVYDRVLKTAYADKDFIDFTFRIIAKDKSIKYIYSKGEFAKRDGKEVFIGVIQDVSNRVENENKLIAQNIELQRRIAELDSFNRVVSHDLQEPLRKIQMFISRILDFEEESLGTRSAQYFNKIEMASSRMRKLIDNLLAFSRIDSKDYEFERVDLNISLQNVLDTFSETLSQLHVNIKSDNLPNVHAIPFLMEQLFTNLIGNSLKYRAANRTTKIIVESTKIHNKRIPQQFIKTHAYYHVIKIIDNGIGFNPNEGEKIFKLFQRLHTRSSYVGTGLGLAICQKIVMKHHGFIYATSVLNEGAVFTIYLPSGKLKALR